MKLRMTIPDGPFAEALIEEAGLRCRAAQDLILDYVRTALIKRGHALPKYRKVGGKWVEE